MKVRYLPSSPKFPLTEHVRNDVGATLVAAGFAEIVPLPRRGDVGWLEAMQEQSRLATKPSEFDTVAGVLGIQWGLQNLQSGKVNIIKRVGSNVYFYDSPPADCPQSITQQFLDACAVNPEANAWALDAAKRAQQAQDREDKTAGRISVLSTLFGSKPL